MGAISSRMPGKYGVCESAEIVDGERQQSDHLVEMSMIWRERAC